MGFRPHLASSGGARASEMLVRGCWPLASLIHELFDQFPRRFGTYHDLGDHVILQPSLADYIQASVVHNGSDGSSQGLLRTYGAMAIFV